MSDIHQAPRSAQLTVVGVYAAIVVLGTIASHTSLGEHKDHYLAQKSNFLNQMFVKRGWLWFSLVFWTSYAVRKNVPSHKLKRPELLHVVARYSAATLWWFLFSQWLLGPPLMDRIFMLTGGSCAVELPSVEASPGSPVLPVPPPLPPTTGLTTSFLCRKTGGLWAGGHDPSGHVFLLVHSSIVLWMEILPDVWTLGPLKWSTKGPLVLLALWGVMLFLTTTYFHPFSENFTGFLFGSTEALVIYFVGESAPWGWLFGVNEHRPEFPRRRVEAKAAESPVLEAE